MWESKRSHEAKYILVRVCQAPKFHGLAPLTQKRLLISRQDLNGAMISGCPRLFDHETFPELYWSRTQLPGHTFDLPAGFEDFRDSFCEDLITVLEDLNAFRVLQEATRCRLPELEKMIYIDNAQAWIESRLCDLGTKSSNLHPSVGCCLTAAYICSYSLFCEIWQGSFITSRLSTRLLQQVSTAVSKISAERYRELFLWLIYIGAAFSDDEDTRIGFVALLLSEKKSLSPNSNGWEDTVSTLRRFIWSETLHYSRCLSVWAESQSFQSRLTGNGDEQLPH